MQAAYLLLGVCSGMLSGILGIGGGIILVPALVYLFGFSQHEAQGTSLAVLIPPIGILAALRYWQEGYVHIYVAVLICLGFLVGAYLGASCIQHVSEVALKRIFGAILLCVSIYMLFGK
jgi:uncharacterized protein